MNDIKHYYRIESIGKYGNEIDFIVVFDKIEQISYIDVIRFDLCSLNFFHLSDIPEKILNDFLDTYKKWLGENNYLDIGKILIPFQKIVIFDKKGYLIYTGMHYFTSFKSYPEEFNNAFYDYQKWLENKYK